MATADIKPSIPGIFQCPLLIAAITGTIDGDIPAVLQRPIPDVE